MQRRGDFQTDVVARIEQSRIPVVTRRLSPVPANHDQHDSTARDLRLDGRSEVGASLNRLDVVEDLFSAEVRLQLVAEPAGGALCVLTPVADKY